jgi:hypothetical protein
MLHDLRHVSTVRTWRASRQLYSTAQCEQQHKYVGRLRLHIESATLTRHISISLMLSVHYEHVMQMSRHATLYCSTASSGTVVR